MDSFAPRSLGLAASDSAAFLLLLTSNKSLHRGEGIASHASGGTEDCRPEHFHKFCSAAESDLKAAVFLVFGFVSAQLQGFQTCAFAKASPITKNPRSASLHHFAQSSNPASGGPPSLQDGWLWVMIPDISCLAHFRLCRRHEHSLEIMRKITLRTWSGKAATAKFRTKNLPQVHRAILASTRKKSQRRALKT